ncbi:MAG: DUF6686 family protein [Bacteroidota bacterium]
MNCRPEVIIEGKYFNISQCPDCKRLGIYYKNLLIGFSPDTFKTFSQSFTNIDFHTMAVSFPDGFKHIIVNSCHYDIQFNFNKTEFEELKKLILQANILLEAKDILDKNNK